MSSSDRARARASLGRKNWRRFERHEVDVELLEDAVKDYRWCAYSRNFLDLSQFSMEQRLKPCGNRFSLFFSNDRQRASKTPSVEIPDEVLRVHLERAHFIVIGVNDIDRAPVVSQRALRAAGRTDQDTEEMVDETVQENAGADFEEDEADAPDANGASGSGSNGASSSGSKRKEAQRAQSKSRKRAGMTAEQQQQSARDRAQRDARLTKEALDEYALDFLPNLVQHDETIHSDDLQRDPGTGSLSTWDEWPGPTATWTTALDDGAPDDARKKAAAVDLQLVNDEQEALKIWQPTPVSNMDAVERNVKLKLLSRVANKLTKIVAGTAGYSDLSRGDWRQQGCAPFIQDGSKYTCIQDSLIVVARYVGCVFNAKDLHDALDDPLKEAEIYRIVNYARDTLGLAMVCVSHGSCGWDGLRRLDLAWLAHGTVWLGCCRSAGLGGSGESGGGLRRWRLHGLQLGSAGGFAAAGHLTVMIGTAECSAMRTAPSIPAGIWTPSCMAVRKAGETSDPHPWPQLGHSSGMAGGMG